MKKLKSISFRLTTEKEREFIIQELAAMIKDLVFMKAEQRAREIVQCQFEINRNIAQDESLTIHYNITFSYDILKMILGKIRRSKK